MNLDQANEIPTTLSVYPTVSMIAKKLGLYVLLSLTSVDIIRISQQLAS